MTEPTTVYYGKREDMIAEVSAFDPAEMGLLAPREYRYLVMPSGDAQFDTEPCATLKAAREYARYVAAQYPGCKVCAI